MKKILLISLLLSLPIIVSAVVEFENPIEATTTAELVDNIADFIFKIAVVIVPLIILIGTFFIVTSAGDPKKIDQGKRLIIWAIIGFAIILFSKGIVVMIRQILGIQGG